MRSCALPFCPSKVKIMRKKARITQEERTYAAGVLSTTALQRECKPSSAPAPPSALATSSAASPRAPNEVEFQRVITDFSNRVSNLSRLVLGHMNVCDSESRCILQHFSRPTRFVILLHRSMFENIISAQLPRLAMFGSTSSLFCTNFH